MQFADETVEQALKRAQDAIFDHPILTAEQEVLLAKRIERGDKFAKAELIRCNTKLARQQAGIHARRCKHLDADDLFAAAVDGLDRAAEKFDWRKGFKFSTYASNWIKHFIAREIANRDDTIRVPVHIVQLRQKMLAAEKAHSEEHHTDISVTELAAELDVPESEITHLRDIGYVASLDKPVGEDGSSTLADFQQAPGEDNVFDRVASDMAADDRDAAWATLSDHEKRILTDRLVHNRGLQEVARKRGQSAMSIRNIEHGAYAKLRGVLPSADSDYLAGVDTEAAA